MLRCTALSIIVLVASSTAHAAEEPDWAVGVGLGGTDWFPVGGLGSLGTLAYDPHALLELRLGGSWWLSADVGASWSSSDFADSSSIGAGLGLRWVIDPDAVVRVAPTLDVGLRDYAYSTDTAENPAHTTTFEAAVGFDLEVGLTGGLSLRASTDVLGLTRSASAWTQDGARQRSTATALAFGLRPELDLVFSF